MKRFNGIFKEQLPYDYRQEFINSNAEIDVNRSRVMLILILFIETVFLLCSFSEKLIPEYGSYLYIYRTMYIIMIAASVVLLALIYVFNRVHNSKVRIKGLGIIGILFILFMLLWGAAITALDISRNICSSVYLYVAFIISIFVFMRPIRSLLMYGISYICYFVLITILVSDSTEVISGMANGGSFILTAWLISVTQYYSRKKQFLSDKIILEKTNQLRRIADMDPLTKTYNRRCLDRLVKDILSNSKISGERVSVMMMDIDYFKEINDTFGHVCGDEVLVQISKVVKKAVNPYNGQVFRYGGDEFCILFLGIQEDELEKLANIIKSWTIDMQIESINSEPNRTVTISIGYSTAKPSSQEEIWDIIVNADNELYKEKSKRLSRRKEDRLPNRII